jgi:hypothetical protein
MCFVGRDPDRLIPSAATRHRCQAARGNLAALGWIDATCDGTGLVLPAAMRTRWLLVLVSLLAGCLSSSKDCGDPGQIGDSLVVHVMSPVDFNQVKVVYTIGFRSPPFTIDTPTGRTYEYEYSSAFHPDAPRSVHFDALSGGVAVAHGDVTGLTYDSIDQGSCSYRTEVALTLAP